MWKSLTLVIFILLIALAVTFQKSKPTQIPTSPNPETKISEVVIEGLDVPWALAFLPASQGESNKNIIFTERKGLVKLLEGNSTKVIAKINVSQKGEGGLHGITLDPKFNENHFLYLYYTYSSDSNNSLNKVSRFTFQNNTPGGLTDEKVIVDKIPGAIFHDGGRIKFGPDSYLYITTGDAQKPSLAQDKNSLAGKILRVKDPSTSSGQVKVYSYGHRNPQGITFDDKGKLWEVEHGQSATDEINLITEGKNYGWPTIRGDEKRNNLESPILHSGSETWAPGGLAFFEDSLYFGGLRGMALFQYNIEAKKITEYFKNEFGRIRDVVLGPDNMLYITTSNKDGRGSPTPSDDKIIKVNPKLLK